MTTIAIAPMDSITIESFDADNPGQWMLHCCHNIYSPRESGMMTPPSTTSAKSRIGGAKQLTRSSPKLHSDWRPYEYRPSDIRTVVAELTTTEGDLHQRWAGAKPRAAGIQ